VNSRFRGESGTSKLRVGNSRLRPKAEVRNDHSRTEYLQDYHMKTQTIYRNLVVLNQAIVRL